MKVIISMSAGSAERSLNKKEKISSLKRSLQALVSTVKPWLPNGVGISVVPIKHLGTTVPAVRILGESEKCRALQLNPVGENKFTVSRCPESFTGETPEVFPDVQFGTKPLVKENVIKAITKYGFCKAK